MFQTYEISWWLSWEYLLSLALVNSDPIYKDYMTTLRSYHRSKLLKTLILTQYSLKVESLYNIITWWIITTQLLMTIYLIYSICVGWLHTSWGRDTEISSLEDQLFERLEKKKKEFNHKTHGVYIDFPMSLSDFTQTWA